MKRILLYILIHLCIIEFTLGQSITISGYVTDKISGEKLIGASVYDNKNHNGSLANNYGFYTFQAHNNDTIHLSASFTGYQKLDTLIISKNNKHINLQLITQVNLINEIEISGEKFSRLEHNISTIKLQSKQVSSLPALMGEADLFRTLQLMPGIQSGTEGTSGLYVRGGSPDQNLVLLDGIPLYYVNHIGGFVSIFDPYSINNVEVIKSGFPARYGGRLSSVIDVRLKDGNLNKFAGEISLGLISSKVALEIPLVKGKSSLMLSARRCNFDIYSFIYSKLFAPDNALSGYTFYDLNLKYNYKISDKNSLFISAYLGRDVIYTKDVRISSMDSSKFIDKSNLKWGNTLASLRWNHVFSNNLFGNLTLAYTKYQYQPQGKYTVTNTHTNNKIEDYSTVLTSKVEDKIIKYDLELYNFHSMQIKTGVSTILHTFVPGLVNLKSHKQNSPDIDTTYGSPKINALEWTGYIENSNKFQNRFFLNYGLYFSQYLINQKIFTSLEPRFSFKSKIANEIYIQTSYALMSQNIHLATSNDNGLPTDLWLPANANLKPEKAHQFSLGGVKYFKSSNVEFSIDGFYKKQTGLVEFKDGVSFFSSSNKWEDKVWSNGTGKIMGLEFFLKKQYSKLNGWISYTISKNTRQFDNLNNGTTFPFKYDRRHDLNIVICYKLNDKIDFSATWTYLSGNAITIAIGKYQALDFNYNQNQHGSNGLQYLFQDAQIYSDKNSIRLPAYQRMDVGINFKKQLKKGARTLNIGIYNVYNQQNVFYLFFQQKGNAVVLYKFVMFPIIPSISYSYKF